MPQVDTQTAGSIISQNLAVAATVTVTCLTPAAGQCNLIKSISCYATAATAADIQITKNDNTSILRLGGVGTGLLDRPLVFASGDDPKDGIAGYAADATKVVFTTVAGTNVECSVQYIQVPA